jgi:hypothetical protein
MNTPRNKFRYEGFSAGQRIRALDFEPRVDRGDCYLEGTITAICREGSVVCPAAHYVVAIERDVWLGEDVSREHTRVGGVACVPMETMPRDYEGRVIAAPPDSTKSTH